MSNIKSNWIKIGVCGVDSGIILITDPSYVLRGTPEFNYNHVSSMSRKSKGQLKNNLGIELAVASSNFGGDGLYSVYALKNSDGHVLELKIAFNNFGE